MLHFAAFHLGLHCLPKYPLRGFRNTKGLIYMLVAEKCFSLLFKTIFRHCFVGMALNTCHAKYFMLYTSQFLSCYLATSRVLSRFLSEWKTV